jgi:cyclic pyranopterin phosphate synthase
MNAEVISVNLSPERKMNKVPVEIGEFIVGFGMKSDGHAGDWHRQVSIFSMESLEKLDKDSLIEVNATYSENITIKGLVIHTLPIGTILEIGETAFEITQIGKPFERDPSTHTPREVIMHKEGVFAVVKRSGIVKAGDVVKIQ